MKIELLVGMIASGKSTYARQRAQAGALVVCHDDLTTMLHAEYRYEAGLRECYRRMEESIVWDAVAEGRDVVIDRTHLTHESRERWLRVARLLRVAGFKVEIVAIAFPIESAHVHATRRFEADPRGRTFLDWHQVAVHHAAQAVAEPLDVSEGFDRIEHPREGEAT